MRSTFWMIGDSRMKRVFWLLLTTTGLALLSGCTPFTHVLQSTESAVARAAPPELLPPLSAPPGPPAFLPPASLPKPAPYRPPDVYRPKPELAPPPKESRPTVAAVYRGPVVPIGLDTVLRLVPDQNGQIALAREKVREASLANDLADKRWLPDLYVGASYYRHENGIQDFEGRLIRSSYGSLFAGVELRSKLDLRDLVFAKVDAERKIWQRSGQLARLGHENLLDAAGTYVDLLAARSAEAIGKQMEKNLTKLLSEAQKKFDIDKALKGAAKAELERVRAELFGQQQLNRKLREGGNTAAARLIYLLGLDPASEVVPVDRQLVMFDLIDMRLPPQVLVEAALTSGPGIRELEGLVGLIESARAKSEGPGRLLPTLEVWVGEGAFGAGPGSRSNWDNRADLCVNAKWNLTDLFTSRERTLMVQSQSQQAQLGLMDLRAKLTLGVQEAREAILSGRDQIKLGKDQIQFATEVYQNASARKDRTVLEVLFAIKSLTLAEYDYLRAVREYDKAQLRLLLLTGTVDPSH